MDTGFYKNMNKIYIGIITQNQKKNIEELTTISHYFDGLAAVDHFSDDGTYEVLKNKCGAGFVEQIPYYGHHGHSMSHFLLHPKIKIGNWIILCDSSERISESFACNIRPFVKMLENNKINTVYNYSKVLLFKVFPHQSVQNTPHFSILGLRPNFVSIEKSGWFNSEKDYFYSLRNEQRGKYDFIDHFMKYYLQVHSNHNLLGLENFGNPAELFPILEQQRIDFLLYLQELGINNDVNSLKSYLVDTNLLPDKIKYFINNNLILNQFYRYHVLNDLTVSPDIKSPIVRIS